MTDDERPEPVSADDIQGLRTDFRGLTHSVDNLAARQKVTDEAVAKKADQATVDRLNELEAGRKSNRRRATAAIVLVLVLIVAGVAVNMKRLADQDADVHARRTADCHSLDDIADANKAGAAAVIRNAVALGLYNQATDARFMEIKRRKGYSADCSKINDPPKPGG